MVGGGGQAILPAANCHCFSKVWGSPGLWGPSLRLQSLAGSSGLGSREAGRQFRKWKNPWGHWKVVWSQHRRRDLKHPSARASCWAGPPQWGSSWGLLWARALPRVFRRCGLQTHRPSGYTLPTLKPVVPVRGSLRHGLLGGKVCGTDGVGGRVGRDGPSGGVAFSCSQIEIGGHRCYCLEGRGDPGTRGARQDL